MKYENVIPAPELESRGKELARILGFRFSRESVMSRQIGTPRRIKIDLTPGPSPLTERGVGVRLFSE